MTQAVTQKRENAGLLYEGMVVVSQRDGHSTSADSNRHPLRFPAARHTFAPIERPSAIFLCPAKCLIPS